MESASIYVGSETVPRLSREALIYFNAEAALARVAVLKRHVVTGKDNISGHSPPGIADVASVGAIIALGKLAHTLLADFQKRSLLASDAEIEEDERGDEDLGQFIWSCANTSRILAIGDRAWRSIQMLPVTDRRRYDVPPLKLPPSPVGIKERRVFIINHDPDDRQARAVAELAIGAGLSVVCSGFSRGPRDKHLPVKFSYSCSEPEIHVHVGHHTVASEAFRLTDSWHSGRLVVQLTPLRGSTEHWASDNLMVDHEVNGFSCRSVDDAITICREIQQDPVLSRKVVASGHRTAEPLARIWSAIAHDLLN